MKLLSSPKINLPKHLNPFLYGLFCLSLILFLVFSHPVFFTVGQQASGQTIKQLRSQQQQIKQQHQGVTKEKQRLTNLETKAKKHLTGLEKNLKTTDKNIQDSEQRLQQASKRLQELEAELIAAQSSYQEQQTAVVARLRFLQRSQLTQGWAILLQSENLNDFFSRRRNLKLLYQADQKILVKLTQQANQIKQQRTEVETKKNEIALIRQQLLVQKVDYQTQAQLQSELVGRLNSDRLALEAAQAQLQKDSQAIGNLIQQKIRAAELAKANSKRNWIRGSGIMAFPSDGRISSPFGFRIHPKLGYRRMHTGMDFAASHGSPIRAADSGTVIFAGWYGGYGYAVIINHGKGITTLYGHSSKLYVSEGESVKRGQVIAAIGSTGLSTGPHLHFEVRKNGTPVNPANYL
ncbi:murein hydrolase activator EnvC family protein [Mastigocoleus testarum]|uniref:Peptidase M23 n=1 Tax=Mastigocoleus testarum BC008 TaxID=371196 RepID=A0A0V7ZVR7_9CYAN|nr:M23 family metallopeptidase [Mastigocoleus testarum]KST68481.1 peptidase M23 [Mastigocoleus testarum BC008]